MIITRDNAKKYLNITDTTYDDRIDMLIPAVENDYLLIRGKAFNMVEDSDDITVDYPENSEVIAAQMIGYQLESGGLNIGLKSEKIGSYSYTKGSSDDMINGYPKSIVGRIERFHKAR